MGRPKQALALSRRDANGDPPESLLRHAARSAVEAALRPIVVVLGAGGDELAPQLAGLPVHAVAHSGWNRGIGSSLKVGLECLTALSPALDGVAVAVCDQPHVSPVVLRRLTRAYRASAATIVASTYAEGTGLPALFDRALFAELEALGDRDGARGVITRDPERIATVPFPLGAVDIDTPEAYQAYLGSPSGSEVSLRS